MPIGRSLMRLGCALVALGVLVTLGVVVFFLLGVAAMALGGPTGGF